MIRHIVLGGVGAPIPIPTTPAAVTHHRLQRRKLRADIESFVRDATGPKS